MSDWRDPYLAMLMGAKAGRGLVHLLGCPCFSRVIQALDVVRIFDAGAREGVTRGHVIRVLVPSIRTFAARYHRHREVLGMNDARE